MNKILEKIFWWFIGITLFFSAINLLLGMPFLAIIDNHWKEHLFLALVFFIPTALVFLFFFITGIVTIIQCRYKARLQAIENVKKRRGDGKYTSLEVKKELKRMRIQRDLLERQAIANVIERLGTETAPHDEVIKEIARLEKQASNDSTSDSSSKPQ